MNEISVAHGLVKDLQQESKRHGVTHVSRVHVRIGSLRNIVPEELSFAFAEASAGTVAEGAELNMRIVPAKGRCGRCNIDFDVETKNSGFPCPTCGGVTEELVCGDELKIALFRGRFNNGS